MGCAWLGKGDGSGSVEWAGDLLSGSLTSVVGAVYRTREEGGVFDWGVFVDWHRGRGDQRCCLCQEGDGQGGNAHDGLLGAG